MADVSECPPPRPRSSTMAGVQRISAMTRPLRTVEFLAELPNQFAFGPCQPIVVSGDDENVLFAPTVALDLFGRTPSAAISSWRPPHRATSCSTAAKPAMSTIESWCFGLCASRSSSRSIMHRTTSAGVTVRPSVSDQRFASLEECSRLAVLRASLRKHRRRMAEHHLAVLFILHGMGACGGTNRSVIPLRSHDGLSVARFSLRKTPVTRCLQSVYGLRPRRLRLCSMWFWKRVPRISSLVKYRKTRRSPIRGTSFCYAREPDRKQKHRNEFARKA